MSKVITEKGKQKILGMAAKRPFEKTIAYLYPEFSDSAIRCVDIEEIKPQQLSPSSPLRIEWQCPCGNTSVFKMIKIIKERKSVLCYDCKIAETKIKNMQKGRINTKKIEHCFPKIATQFMEFVDYPGLGVDSVSTSCRYDVKWKCECGKPFVSKLANKDLSNLKDTDTLTCPDCTYENVRKNNFGKVNMSTTVFFKDAFPAIYKQLMRLADPKDILPLEKVSTQSAKKAIWKCNCGIEFERQISIVTNTNQAVCKVCNRKGESLFELEMKELLEATLKLKVISQHSKENLPKVDLYIPELDTAIQLDPFYFHKRREESDLNIDQKQMLAYTNLVRLREVPLKQFTNSIPVKYDIKYIDKWLEAILVYLNYDGDMLGEDAKEKALIKANKEWNLTFQTVKNNITLSKYFPYFVKNLTHPGRKPEYTPAGSGDLCVWLCDKGHERILSPAQIHRKSRKNECTKCKKENNLLIEKAPQLAKSFIKCLEDDTETIETISINSTKVCLWKCDCGYPVKSSVAARFRTYENINHQGHYNVELNELLTELGIKQIFPLYEELHTKKLYRATRSALKKEEIANRNISKTIMSAEFKKNLTSPNKPIEELTLGSHDICVWECKNGHVRKLSPKQIFGKNKVVSCRICFAEQASLLKNQKLIEKQKKEQERIAKTIGFNFPYSKEEFVVNLDSPKRDTNWISKTSREMCIWKCRKCNQYLKTQVRTRWESCENDFASCLHDTLTLEQVNEYLKKANLPAISE